jgi:drug/metabolite transporter (DMT)-like permease
VVTSSATVTCQLLAKHGVARIAPLDFSGQPLRTIMDIARSPFIVGGLAVQAGGFAIWLTVIARTNLTWAVGVASALVYILTAVLNWLLLNEGVTRIQALGLLLLVLGTVLLSWGPIESSHGAS